MAREHPRVLIISSVDPTKGTGTVALNFYKVLKAAGIAVDFMTKHPVEDYPEFISVLPPENKPPQTFLEKALAKADRKSLLAGARNILPSIAAPYQRAPSTLNSSDT